MLGDFVFFRSYHVDFNQIFPPPPVFCSSQPCYHPFMPLCSSTDHETVAFHMKSVEVGRLCPFYLIYLSLTFVRFGFARFGLPPSAICDLRCVGQFQSFRGISLGSA
ncbi:hypothetical protein CRM22_006061 [Opisthorchis felineus]|uniref:Uncharacterized protein n=1 Tax=Opisthorchis felineus TaxID=147828 RepID=A0A4S2LU56_OPIFE|nr:hypothetical protein CRM22_006061 [Opisthorchis felineus]